MMDTYQAVLIVIFVLLITGNGVMTYVACRTNKLFPSPSTSIITALSVMGLMLGTWALTPAAIHTLDDWDLSKLWCMGWKFLHTFCIYGYAFLMVATVAGKFADQWFGRSSSSIRRTRIMIFISVALAIIMSLVYTIWEEVPSPHLFSFSVEHYCYFFMDELLIHYYSACAYWVPIILIISLYVGIWFRTFSHRSSSPSTEINNEGPANETLLCTAQRRQLDDNLSRALTIVVCWYALSWLPITLTELARVVWAYKAHPVVEIMGLLLGFSSPMINPLIFLVVVKGFRVTLLKICCRRTQQDEPSSEVEL